MRRSPLRSPPRMRGKVHPAHHTEQGDGITPAYAGKRMLVGECPKPLWDHPRVCGEKNNTAKTYSNMEGSPPRMRGKDGVNDSAQAVTGITPAYAGKRGIKLSIASMIWDHPRVCGEMGSSTFWSRNHSGSPPRMRGKEGGDLFAAVVDGITPACAGKS